MEFEQAIRKQLVSRQEELYEWLQSWIVSIAGWPPERIRFKPASQTFKNELIRSIQWIGENYGFINTPTVTPDDVSDAFMYRMKFGPKFSETLRNVSKIWKPTVPNKEKDFFVYSFLDPETLNTSQKKILFSVNLFRNGSKRDENRLIIEPIELDLQNDLEQWRYVRLWKQINYDFLDLTVKIRRYIDLGRKIIQDPEKVKSFRSRRFTSVWATGGEQPPDDTDPDEPEYEIPMVEEWQRG